MLLLTLVFRTTARPRALLAGLLLLMSCQSDDEANIDPEVAALLPSLETELVPLDSDPLRWGDAELAFLDPIAGKSIVALGESTHGTAEFFNAKRRIFRYLVEQHGYRVFAFEADFGESLFIDGAVQAGRRGDIASLMSEKMHFWTWRTLEVRNLLEWMSEYNVGKPPGERVHYVGVDCQYNTFHPDLVRQYLSTADASLRERADLVLAEAETASKNGFKDYSEEQFATYLDQLDTLQDLLVDRQALMVTNTSSQAFALHQRLLRVVRQVSEVNYYRTLQDYTMNYRDRYMAKNTAWLLEYYPDEKIVLWAHNAHVANDPAYGSIGFNLTNDHADDYTTVAFMFSRGDFTAVKVEDEKFTGLGKQTIDAAPMATSLNGVFSNASHATFTVAVSDLQKHDVWNDYFAQGTTYLSVGSAYNNQPSNYYRGFSPTLYDRIIYIDQTTASVPF